MKRNLLSIPRQISIRMLSAQTYHPPNLSNLPTRWNSLDPPLKEEIQEYLDWQMRGDWRDMSRDELKSAYHIGYGPWGPRSKFQTKDRTGQTDINIPYLVIRGLFNIALFSAVGVAMVNINRDKQNKNTSV